MTGIFVWRKPALAACLVVALAFSFFTPAQARSWKPTAQVLAQDYALITDTRPNNEIIILYWLVPPIVGDTPEARAVLDQYIVIGAVHGHMSNSGVISFDDIPPLDLKDGNGRSLKELAGDNVPPVVAGIVTAMDGLMRQAIGAMGQGMHFFVYDNGGVHACSKGQLSISYLNETYTYDTPIPGCPAN